jgi:cytochrome c-type biogenesis protein CcsB
MKTAKFLFSPALMAVLMLILAVVLAIATLIENKFGAGASRGMIYDTHWLEIIFILLAINLTGQIFKYKLYRREKLTIMLFHLALIIMITGAAITRYAGFDGTMNIREGETTAHVKGKTGLSLPFTMTLNNFVVDRYPGSNSPSGFKSNITVKDGKKEFPCSIYMNHVLKYKGYRFFQSSYDKDEKGTVLSVSHDPVGTAVTYSGYFLLFLFIILSLFNRHSFFRTVTATGWSSSLRRVASVVVIGVLTSFSSLVKSQELVPEKQAAEHFGAVLAQDQKGRTKPLYTISNDILRKVSGKKSFNGLTPMQVFMGYSIDFEHWQKVQLIRISDNELKKVLGIRGDYASFDDIVTLGETNRYKLAPYIERAYSKPANARTHFDKEVIKTDERLNICYMMGRGDFLRIFPVRDSTGYWGTPEEAIKNAGNYHDSVFISSLIPVWTSLATGKTPSAKNLNADQCVAAIRSYQKELSTYSLPSLFRTESEIFYYKAGIFEKLFPFYTAAGFLLLILVITAIIMGSGRGALLARILVVLITTGFMFHTLGLGIRWYISGHSPMSNGYETMLFVSWVTMLAGFIFGRKSMLPVAATTFLSGMTLMVAHLSFMDPEITNLVPVLKSYLLTLHVSVITGSYAFLGLGAVLGLIALVMLLFVNNENSARIADSIDQITVINVKVLILGLYFLTIGTFLGAVWANESWGRYWGWDPKETWALICIIVYTLVIHSRLIPWMKDVYIFNLLSLVAFSSVLMTYFGVNYYLQGMHSYGQGDSAPLPLVVYIAIALVALLAVFARVKYRAVSRKVT